MYMYVRICCVSRVVRLREFLTVSVSLCSLTPPPTPGYSGEGTQVKHPRHRQEEVSGTCQFKW